MPAASVMSGTIRNVDSARASMPMQLKPFGPDGSGGWTWRVDLAATEQFWQGALLMSTR